MKVQFFVDYMQNKKRISYFMLNKILKNILNSDRCVFDTECEEKHRNDHLERSTTARDH